MAKLLRVKCEFSEWGLSPVNVRSYSPESSVTSPKYHGFECNLIPYRLFPDMLFPSDVRVDGD